jgi:hypothetical protein
VANNAEQIVQGMQYLICPRLSTQHTLVGSSSSKMSGLTKSAAASATRMRHPPDRALVGPACISGVTFSPARMADALRQKLKAARLSPNQKTAIK